MARIMSVGETESRSFSPITRFGISIIAETGSIPDDAFLYYSPDGGQTWLKAHDTSFSDVDYSGLFEYPVGFKGKFMSEGGNLAVDVNYTPNLQAYYQDITDNIDRS